MADMTELMEILDNPRQEAGSVAIKMPKGGIKLSKRDLAQILGPSQGGGGKKKKKRRAKPRLDKNMVIAGAIAAQALEVYVFRRAAVTEKIPDQIEQYTAALTGVVGWMMSKAKKQKPKMKSFWFGMAVGGFSLQGFYEIMKRANADAKAATLKVMGEALKSVSGLGYWPPGPQMTASEAAAALGMSNAVPNNPYNLGALVDYGGDLGRSGGGLGELVYGRSPLDPALNPALQPAGLGVFDDGGYDPLSGQFGTGGDW